MNYEERNINKVSYLLRINRTQSIKICNLISDFLEEFGGSESELKDYLENPKTIYPKLSSQDLEEYNDILNNDFVSEDKKSLLKKLSLIERIEKLERLVSKRDKKINEGMRRVSKPWGLLYRDYKDAELHPFSPVKINPPEPEDIKWSTFPGESYKLDDGTEEIKFRKLSANDKLKFLVLWFKVNFQLNFRIRAGVILLPVEEFNKSRVKKLSSIIERGLNSFNEYFNVNFRYEYFELKDQNDENSDDRYLYKIVLIPGNHHGAYHYFEI